MVKIIAAAVQAAPRLFDQAETIDRFAHWLSQARNAGADLVVFPESFLGGYPKGVDFGVRVGSRDDAGRQLFEAYYSTSFDPFGEPFARIRSLVADAGLHVVTGVMEQAQGTLYCSAATIGPDGALLNWHRKLMPTAMERVIWGFGDGSTDRVVQTDIGRISMSICWENYMPLHRSHLYHQRTELYTVPTVDDRDVWLPSMQMIALEGRCFVISACQHMTRADIGGALPYDALQGNDPETVLIGGGSCIVSPTGDVLAAPLRGGAGLVTAEIDLSAIIRGKFDLDGAGHYGRQDIFTLSVDGSDALGLADPSAPPEPNPKD